MRATRALGATLRTRFDAAGVSVAPCPAGWRAEGIADDCLAPVSGRVWSSPIWVDVPAARD